MTVPRARWCHRNSDWQAHVTVMQEGKQASA